MIRIEQLSVTVSIEGQAEAGEAEFARLFEKFSRVRDERMRSERERAAAMARDRRIFGGGR